MLFYSDDISSLFRMPKCFGILNNVTFEDVRLNVSSINAAFPNIFNAKLLPLSVTLIVLVVD